MVYFTESNVVSAFKDYESARAVRDRIGDFACELGHIKVADLFAIIPNIDQTSCQQRSDAGWTLDAVKRITISERRVGPIVVFDLVLPTIDYYEPRKSRSTNGNQISDEPHPIYINVTTSDMDDPDCILCSVLAHAQKISDRDVFINVY